MADAGPENTQRLLKFAFRFAGLILILVGAFLWYDSGNSTPDAVSIVLFVVGAADLLISGTIVRIISRGAAASSSAGYDGESAEYQEGDRPPGML